jgi:hypothetical protein
MRDFYLGERDFSQTICVQLKAGQIDLLNATVADATYFSELLGYI